MSPSTTCTRRTIRDHAACQAQIDERERAIDAGHGTGVDALIVDCSYTRDEYPAKQGWGHGTFDAALAMALRVGAQSPVLHPPRADPQRRRAGSRVRRSAGALRRRLACLQVYLAYEGLEVEL